VLAATRSHSRSLVILMEDSSMTSETLSRVVAFTAAQARVKPANLGAVTTLGGDLGMDGDDASEYMQAFSKEFLVDLSGFEFGRYFGPELPLTPFGCLGILLSHLPGHAWTRTHLEEISLSDLAEAVERGKWKVVESEPG
jgi:hypothetical protein